MKSLIVDSSTKTLYIALVNDDVILEERYITGRNDHAKNIVSGIASILENADMLISQLDRIIVGVGPGSYTGVRMAVTVGKMVACNTSVKLYKISSLYLMSSGLPKALAMIDARRGNSFCGAWDNDKLILEEGLRVTEDCINEYKDYPVVNEDMMIVDPKKVIKNAEEVLKPHGLEPNYLRQTEAERNLVHD